jgi:arylsulfatase A-like enzyme
MPADRSRWLPAILAGLTGGALAGLIDGLVGALGARGQGAKAVALPLAALGLWGLCSALGAGGYAALCAALGRARRQSDPSPSPRAMAATATLLAAPLVIHDALAMFGGGKASKIPGRVFISLALAAAGLALVFVGARALARALARLPQRAGGRSVSLAIGGGAGLLAGAIHVANIRILPRLYPWFHLTLALLFVLVLVLAVRFLLARRVPAPTPPPALVAALVLVVAVSGAVGVALLRGSQGLLFLASQRTQLLSRAIEALPPAMVRRRLARAPADLGPEHAGPPLPPGPRRPDADVVIITIDALRADHVGAYGYARNTTPNIDALARRGIRFHRAYAQAPNTSFSVTSMLTGKYYPTLARLAPPEGHDTLPIYLRRYGWKTAAFHPEAQALFFVQGDKLQVYRDSQFDFEYVKAEYLDAHAQLARIAEFFAGEKGKSDRFFLWVHYFEPHEPYEKWPGHDFGNRDIDRYDSEIAYTDAAVGQLLAYLEKHRPGSVIILAADHGEEFDEHGSRYHGKTLYDEQVRIPLIIAVPGVAAAVVEGPAELVDVAPTVLGLLDIPIPMRMRGTDLGPWLNSPPPPSDGLGLAFAEVDDLRMAASARDKLLCNVDRGFCAYYDLTTDPREQTNLADARPQRVAELQARLDRWLASQRQFAGGGGDSALERARLGDSAAAADLAGLLSSPDPATAREAARLLVVNLPPRPETRAALARARQSDDPTLRAWAAVAALRAGDAGARDSVRRLVGEGTLADLRLHAGLALAAAGDDQAVPALAAALPGCPDPATCRHIISALATLGDRRATRALVAHLDSVLTRREVVAALAKLGDPTSAAALEERLLKDEYVPVRIEAARALAHIGGPAARTALGRARRSEREPQVKAAIAEALATARR